MIALLSRNRFPLRMTAARLAFFTLLLTPGIVPAQEIAPAEAGEILKQLRQIKEQREGMMRTQQDNALKQLRSAMASDAAAVNFYEEATRATQFAGANRENTQFRDWKKQEADLLKSDAAQRALRHHLNYLALTLERANGAEIKDLMPGLLSHANSLVADTDVLHSEDKKTNGFVEGLLRKSVADGIFAKWLQFGSRLQGLKEWEMAAGDATGIYAKSILPEMRRTRDARLLQYWDAQIQIEGERAAKKQLAFAAGDFLQVRKPALLWKRAEDMLVLGQEGRAVTEMFNLVKSNPDHPDAGNWIKRLEELLAKEGGVPGATEQQTNPAGSGS